jgi:hypothetical protein
MKAAARHGCQFFVRAWVEFKGLIDGVFKGDKQSHL